MQIHSLSKNTTKMYERGKEVTIDSSVGLMAKNLQVVSFDTDWLEIYLGTVSILCDIIKLVNIIG